MKKFDPVEIALQEDIGAGDVTGDFCVPEYSPSLGRVIAREKAIIAGSEPACEVFRRIDPELQLKLLRNDGNEVNSGDTILEIRGEARSILKAERVALNFLQQLSGIATLTRKFVNAADSDHVKILDTRKTTPGLRALEKAAVRAGGGQNHRFGLFDMVLVKDNHLALTADFNSFAAVLKKVRKQRPKMRIEVEADSLDQVHAFLQLKEIDVILLDNMTPAHIREAVALGKGKVKFEASGGVTLKNIRQIAATGVDYVSIGALTHSPRAIDLSLELTPLMA